MELAGIGFMIFGLSVVAISQRIIQRNSDSKANELKEELEAHRLKMQIIKMQQENEQLEGNNRCKNISIKELL